jgi:hypothetical protein
MFKKNKKLKITQEPLHLDSRTILQNNHAACSWPSIYYDRLQTIVSICSPATIVEIGVAYGYHALDLLRRNPHLNYFGVDPYVANYDLKDSFSSDVEKLFGLTGQIAMDTLYETVNRNLELEFPGRSTLIRSSSETIVQNFEDASIDMIFIDGDHRYEPVLRDLNLWFPKIRSGGVISGDDWDWKQVRDAVINFADVNAMNIVLLNETKNDHTLFLMVKP